MGVAAMTPPLPFEALYFFGCEKCKGTYLSIILQDTNRKSYNISKTAVMPINRPKACCPDCNMEDRQVTLVDLLMEDMKFKRVNGIATKFKIKGLAEFFMKKKVRE